MDEEPSKAASLLASFNRQSQIWQDWSTPHIMGRWILFVVLLGIYILRVFYANGWFIITYGLGIYLLNNFIGFISPQADPDADGPSLPTKDSEEFKPFSRNLPEFKFWRASAKAVCVAFCMTLFKVFDIPVFWPILLLYFIVLFVLTMKKQIAHMVKHRYVPWSTGKAKYQGKAKKDSK